MSKGLMWVVVIVAAFAGIMAMVGRITDYKALYPMTGKVVYVDHYSDFVEFRDSSGNLWEFRGAEDWLIGDICSVIMDDRGTREIEDDAIVRVRHGGILE